MKLLLTSVFGPYGVDDEYGRKANKMELLHNQVTREQGMFSIRFNHNSFGLYFLAENIDVPSTILDFPSLKRFEKEVRKGYEYIGISFIVPNFKKAQKMAAIVREISPKTKIILGGHGVSIPNIETKIENDYLCKGEGVRFLREFFGEDTEKPIKHPLMHGSFNKRVMGAPLPLTTGLVIPGVGCPNKCRFCATSHFFGDYTPFLKTGKDIYDVCCEHEEKLGVTDFGVMDENFLKMKDRAMELLELIEKNDKKFVFGIFSSAETLKAIGDLDILVRLGIRFIWIGVESKKEIYEKNKGVDFHDLISELRKRGIAVLVSAILFLEEHTKETIWDDIDFATSLRPDYLQFMQLGPVPGTSLYKDYDNKDKLLKMIPYEDQHGQDRIWFKHENFTLKESNEFLKKAFHSDYKLNGASLLRAIETGINGYRYTINHKSELVRRRAADFYKYIRPMRCLLLSASLFKENKASSRMIKNIKVDFKTLLGYKRFPFMMLSGPVLLMSIKEYFRLKLIGDTHHPSLVYRKNA